MCVRVTLNFELNWVFNRKKVSPNNYEHDTHPTGFEATENVRSKNVGISIPKTAY